MENNDYSSLDWFFGGRPIVSGLGSVISEADETEATRKELIAELGHDPGSRESLEKKYGKVWDTTELQTDFEVTGFMAPFVVVKRKSDGAVGSLMFTSRPRFYFSFTEDK